MQGLEGAIMMKSVYLLGCAFLTATSLALYGASATTPPTPQATDPHAAKPFDGPVLAQGKVMETRSCNLCHQPHEQKSK